jgi:osmotically inducible lipoprotein OsmB
MTGGHSVPAGREKRSPSETADEQGTQRGRVRVEVKVRYAMFGEGWTMRNVAIGFVVMVLIAVGGCAGLSETQQRTLTGGTAGAAGGAVIGAIAGNAGLGAAIGAGTGLLGGYLYGQYEEGKQEAYQQGVTAGYNQARQQPR